MDGLHVLLAFAAGGGLFLSWGYRTALHVALGKESRVSAPRPPRGDSTSLPVPISNARREELTR